MRFAELEGVDVAVWGYGREARSVLAALQRRFPRQLFTLYCKPDEAAALRVATDSCPSRGEKGEHGVHGLRVRTKAPDAAALGSHAVVVKSPGISAYRPEILAASAQGTRFTSGTALWFGENPDARVVAVTGTKGKSTTTALIAHLARSLGVRTALAGNIGLPLLDLDGQHADLWAIELSSFQTGDAGQVELGVVVSLGEEHLDWHGTRERYVTDKLKLAGVSRTLLVEAGTPLLMARTALHPNRFVFDDVHGWHVSNGSIMRGRRSVLALDRFPLRGLHNARNACAALAAIELLGLDAPRAAAALTKFKALPHRLTPLGSRAGLAWIDDSISTTPDAALAALASLHGRRVTLILGGHDRGLDWSAFAAGVSADPPVAIVVQGAAGPRIARTLNDAGVAFPVEETHDLVHAMTRARALTPRGGVVLLSPGAPSFDQFRNYAERGRTFAQLAGFDPAVIGEIPGVGIA